MDLGKEIIQTSKYSRTYNSYSGCDIVASINISIPGQEPIHHVFGSIQTLSYSIHQEKAPVRSVGNVNAIAYVDGPRTIAGTIVFTVLDKHVIYEIFEELTQKGQYVNQHYLMDELPNFDITLSFANEYGHNSSISIYNCTIMDEGQVMSINDILTENTYHYYATDIDYMTESESYWTLNRQKIIESNPWLSPQNFKPKPKKEEKEIDMCPLEKVQRTRYKTYAEYVTALNKEYDRFRNILVKTKETSKIIGCRHKYHALVKSAMKYYKIGDMPYGKNRIPVRRKVAVNKDYDKFRTEIHKTSRAVPDYANCRVREHTGPISAPDFKIRESRSHYTIIPPDEGITRLSYISTRDYPEFNTREPIKTSRSYPRYQTKTRKHYREHPPEYDFRLNRSRYKINVPDYESKKIEKVNVIVPEFDSRTPPNRRRDGYPDFPKREDPERKIIPLDFDIRISHIESKRDYDIPDFSHKEEKDKKNNFKNRKLERIRKVESKNKKRNTLPKNNQDDSKFNIPKREGSEEHKKAKKEETPSSNQKFRIKSVIEERATRSIEE